MPLPKKNKLPSLNDFEDASIDDVDIDDVYYEEDIEEEVSLPEIEDPELPDMEDVNGDDDPFIESEPEPERIDKKKKKIIPTGGKKSKRTKVKASDLDDRKNMATRARIIRIFLILVVLVITGLGIKNTFFPKQIYTPEEIDYLVKTSMGQTGFPLERGRQLAEAFVRDLLNDNKENIGRDARLVNMLTGNNVNDGGVSLDFYSKTNGVEQVVLSNPSTYEYDTLTDYLGRYKISTLVASYNEEDLKTTTSGDNAVSVAKAKENLYNMSWVNVNINVYFDKKTGNLSIIRDSVSLLPGYSISDDSNIPPTIDLGNKTKDEEVIPTFRPLINGYFKAYASSSDKSHEEILQYIPSESDPSLYSGYGGQVELDGDPESAIRYEPYKTDDPNEWKVAVVVRWKTVSGDSRYTSRFTITVSKSGDKLLVTKILPYTYIHE